MTPRARIPRTLESPQASREAFCRVARRSNFGKAGALASEREPSAAGVLIDHKCMQLRGA